MVKIFVQPVLEINEMRAPKINTTRNQQVTVLVSHVHITHGDTLRVNTNSTKHNKLDYTYY